MIKVIFVCLGNICRSPLAEGVFGMYCKETNQDSIRCDSAGTAGYHIGSMPDKRSIQVARENGIELKHLGRKLEKEDFEDFDFIVVMDIHNYKDVMNLKQSSKGDAQVVMMRDFDPEGKGDVPDPYYGTYQDFTMVYEICRRSSKKLLDFILQSKI
jgi:protein-tyrosine phosphatase